MRQRVPWEAQVELDVANVMLSPTFATTPSGPDEPENETPPTSSSPLTMENTRTCRTVGMPTRMPHSLSSSYASGHPGLVMQIPAATQAPLSIANAALEEHVPTTQYSSDAQSESAVQKRHTPKTQYGAMAGHSESDAQLTH